MPIYLGNTEIGSQYVDSYLLGSMYLGTTKVNDGDNGQIKSNTLVANFNTWDTNSYPGSGSTWTNLVSGGGNLNLVSSANFTQGYGYYPTSYFTITTSSYGTGSLTNLSPPDVMMMQAWIYTSGVDDTVVRVGDPYVFTDEYFGIGVRTNGNMAVSFANQFLGWTSTNTLNKWVNIAGTLSLGSSVSTIKGYVNGVSVGATNLEGRFVFEGNTNMIIGPNGPYRIGQILVSNNVANINDSVIYQNYFTTKQYFGY
jgi:hypothetical protein